MAGFEEDTDVARVLVPVDVVNRAGAIVSVTAGGVELAEDTNPPWASGTTYAAGARVYSASTHRVYESLKDNNVGKDPTLQVNQVSAAGPTWWLDYAPTNRTAMFDGLVNSQTITGTSPLAITLAPGAFNGIGLFGIDADTMTITILDAPGGNVVYSEVGTVLEGSMPEDYYEYFYEPFRPLTQLTRTDLDPYQSSQITLTLTKAAGEVKLGMFAIGDMRPIGIPQRDASVEPTDFSGVKTDEFGRTSVRKRHNATGMSISAVLEKEEANGVLNTLRDVLGTPVVVVGSEAQLYEWMTVFGLLSSRMTPVPYPYATVSLTVKGMI